MNKGERDEVIAIMKLIEVRDKKATFDGKQINSIIVNGQECGRLPVDFSFDKFTALADNYLTCEALKYGVGKAPALSKADVLINSVGYSLKSNRSAPPALVNHTARPGFENVIKKVGSEIITLDGIIEDYWNLRKKGIIAEDVKNSDVKSPFSNHLEYFRPILNYFFFTGTGSKDSKVPAEKTVNILDPLSPEKWTVYNKTNALDLYWDKLIFSLRASKGMPKGYPDSMTKRAEKTKSSVAVWTELSSGKYRGALHIRASR